MYPENKAVPFAVCLQSPSDDWREIGELCSERLGLNWDLIEDCTNTYDGKQAQFYNALATKAAQVKSVPTLIVDGTR